MRILPCGNWAKIYLPDIRIRQRRFWAPLWGKKHPWCGGRTPEGPVTFARISTDDAQGVIRTYVGEGQFTNDPLDTFGSRAVVEIPGLQDLLKYICLNGFEHHVAMNASHTADILADAFESYMNWDVYYHHSHGCGHCG